MAMFVKTTDGWKSLDETVYIKTSTGWKTCPGGFKVKTSNGWSEAAEWIWSRGTESSPTHYQYWSSNPNIQQNAGNCYGGQPTFFDGAYVQFKEDDCNGAFWHCSACNGSYKYSKNDHEWGPWERDVGSSVSRRVCARGQRALGESNTHFQVCGSSNGTGPQYFSHSYQVSVAGPAAHTGACTRCGYESTVTHTFNKRTQLDTKQHQIVCNVCNPNNNWTNCSGSGFCSICGQTM